MAIGINDGRRVTQTPARKSIACRHLAAEQAVSVTPTRRAPPPARFKRVGARGPMVLSAVRDGPLPLAPGTAWPQTAPVPRMHARARF